MGFLHATPKGARVRRFDTYRKPPLPEITAGDYIRDAFLAMGCAADRPLTWAEIHAYSQLTGQVGLPWEAQLIRAMSTEYILGLERGKDPFAFPPYEGR